MLKFLLFTAVSNHIHSLFNTNIYHTHPTMKKIIFSMFSAISIFGLANAATTITAANYILSSGYATQVVTSTSNTTPFIGTLMIGTFSTPAGLGTTEGPISLNTYGWTMFASTPFNVSTNQPGLFGATGSTGTLPTAPGGPFIGNTIFMVVANAANNDFIVWQTPSSFVVEDPTLGGTPVTVRTNTSTLLRGNVVTGGNNGLAGAAGAYNGQNAVTFGAAAPIPETSTTLLGALGALALLRRRRN